MDASLSSLINLYTFSTGRLLFGIGQVRKAAKDSGYKELVAHCDATLQHGQHTRALETKWAAAPATPKGQGEVQRIDVLVDRTLVAIRDTTQAHADGGDDEIAEQATALLKAILPAGVQAVTQATFVEELAAVEGIVASLKKKELAPIVSELGLGRLVKRLTKLAADYRTAMEAPEAEALSFGDVRAARTRGQEYLLQTVAMILGKYPGSTPEQAEARSALLAPILKQNEAIRLYLRSRRAVQDVNPETGVVDPTAPPVVEPPAGDKTPA